MQLKHLLTFSFILILSFHNTFFAQDYLWDDKITIIEAYVNAEIDSTKTHYDFDSTINRFSLLVSGIDSLHIDYYFQEYENGTIDEFSTCDSIVFSLYSERCIPIHTQRLIDTKWRKWQKLSDSLYFSRKWVAKSSVQNKPGVKVTVPYLLIDKQESHTQITLFTKVLLVEEWKRMKKAIK
jgi:hypothetical protein